MSQPSSQLLTELNEPILFRTSSEVVYRSALNSGAVWLRSADYFQQIEDAARADRGEGINSGTTSVPLRVASPAGVTLKIEGPGQIGQKIVPHYILSLHGASIRSEVRESFGGWTFGVRSLSRLSAEVLYRASLQISVNGYRFGPVHYQFSSLALSHSSVGKGAIQISRVPPLYLNPISTDVLRKLPLEPFVGQDEWRIAIFTDGYLNQDPNIPLKLNVDPSHFFPYLEQDQPVDKDANA